MQVEETHENQEPVEDQVQESSSEEVVEEQEAPKQAVGDEFGYARLEDMPSEDVFRQEQIDKENESEEEPVEEPIEETQEEVQEPESQEQEQLDEGPEPTDEVDWNTFSEEVGIEVESGEDLVAKLQEYKELKEGAVGSDLPKDIQTAIEVFKQGGDYRKALEVLSKDFDKMAESSPKDVLREKFFLDNSELVNKNRALAEKQFERAYNAKYGVLDGVPEDEIEREDYLEENKDDIEFANLSKEQDIADAKEALNKWKDEHSYQPDEVRNEMSDEDRQSLLDEHYSSIDTTAEDFGGVRFPIDDNPENDVILGVEDEDGLKESVRDPRNFLSDKIGYDPVTGEIDYGKFFVASHIMNNLDSLASVIGDIYMERADKSTVEEIIENPSSKRQPDHVRQPGVEGILSAAEKIGQALKRS